MIGSTPLFKTGTYSVSRPGADSYVDGIRAIGAPTVFNVDAGVQPLSGRDLKTLPEAFHATDLRKLYTVTELQIGDVVTIESEGYTVRNVAKWSVLGTHYRVIVSRAIP